MDLRSGELFRLGERVRLQRLPFELLSILLERAGEIVTREELRTGLWDESTHVDFEHGLNTAMRKLRRALEDSADAPRFVETVPGRGYRLRVSAESGDVSDAHSAEVAALTSTISRIARPPFLGRARELRQLEMRLSLAGEGQGGVVLLAGEPGIGKTRLLEEFALVASRRGALVLTGRCLQGESAPPYAPIREALSAFVRSESGADALGNLSRDVLSIAAKVAPALRERWPDLPEPTVLRPEEERHRLNDAIAQLVSGLAHCGSVALLVDDLHWADPATLGVLAQLGYPLARSAFLLVGAYRDVEVDRAHPLASTRAAFARLERFEELRLAGLAEDSVRDLLRAVAVPRITSDAAAGLHRATNGNPFFLREILLQWARDEEAPGDIGASIVAPSLPNSVRGAIGQRLEKLSDDARQLLAIASGFHGTFHFDASSVAAEIDADAALDALDEALEAQLIRGAGRPDDYDYSHALIRHSLYESLTPARRVRVHRRLAEAMAAETGHRADERVGQIAEQFWLSRELPGAEHGVTYCLRAADRAEAAADYAGTSRFIGMALDLLPGADASRPRFLSRLGLALAWSGEAESAVRVGLEAAEAIATSEGASAAADYLCGAADAVWMHDWNPRAWELAARGRAYIGARRDLTWARLSAHEVMAQTAGDPELPGMARDTQLRREVFHTMLVHRHEIPTFEQNEMWRVQIFSSRQEVLERLHELPPALTIHLGDYPFILTFVRSALEQAVARGQLAAGALMYAEMSMCEGTLGNLDAAELACAKALELIARSGNPMVPKSLSLSIETQNATLRGQGIAECLPRLEAVLPSDSPLRYLLSPHEATVAYGYALLGRSDEACRIAFGVLPAIEAGQGWKTNYLWMVDYVTRTYWEFDRAEHAAMLERNLREKWIAPDFRYPRSDGRLVLALLCALQKRYDEAVDSFARARCTLENEGARPLRAIADFDEAWMYLRRGARGDRARARPLLDAAVTQFEAIGMPGWIRRAETLARV